VAPSGASVVQRLAQQMPVVAVQLQGPWLAMQAERGASLSLQTWAAQGPVASRLLALQAEVAATQVER